MGTNNQSLLDDPMYLGLRRSRPSLEEVSVLDFLGHCFSTPTDHTSYPTPTQATEFMDEFMQVMADIFPGIVIQHEDFESEKAFHFLERYQHKYSMFNDDVSARKEEEDGWRLKEVIV